jgi:hypothetical protein
METWDIVSLEQFHQLAGGASTQMLAAIAEKVEGREREGEEVLCRTEDVGEGAEVAAGLGERDYVEKGVEVGKNAEEDVDWEVVERHDGVSRLIQITDANTLSKARAARGVVIYRCGFCFGRKGIEIDDGRCVVSALVQHKQITGTSRSAANHRSLWNPPQTPQRVTLRKNRCLTPSPNGVTRDMSTVSWLITRVSQKQGV